jgi:plasmid stability protein
VLPALCVPTNAATHGEPATLTNRRLDPKVKERLRQRATRLGRSMEAEAGEILKQALAARPETGEGFYAAIRRRFAPLGGVELDLPPREPGRMPPEPAPVVRAWMARFSASALYGSSISAPAYAAITAAREWAGRRQLRRAIRCIRSGPSGPRTALLNCPSRDRLPW